MIHAPPLFRARVSAHNSHAIFLAMLSLLGAAALWVAAYFFFTLILLGLYTAATGDWDTEMPGWIRGWAAGGAGALFLAGGAERLLSRYPVASDRPIIGWHLVPDVLLLPVRLTFACADNLRAIRLPDARESGRAWELLCHIRESGRASLSALGYYEGNPAKLRRRLELLQLVGFVDLQRRGDEWVFTVKGDQACLLDTLIAECRA